VLPQLVALEHSESKWFPNSVSDKNEHVDKQNEEDPANIRPADAILPVQVRAPVGVEHEVISDDHHYTLHEHVHLRVLSSFEGVVLNREDYLGNVAENNNNNLNSWVLIELETDHDENEATQDENEEVSSLSSRVLVDSVKEKAIFSLELRFQELLLGDHDYPDHGVGEPDVENAGMKGHPNHRNYLTAGCK